VFSQSKEENPFIAFTENEHQLQWLSDGQLPDPQALSQEQSLNIQLLESSNIPEADRGFAVPVGHPFSRNELSNRVSRFPKSLAVNAQNFQSLEKKNGFLGVRLNQSASIFTFSVDQSVFSKKRH
jgi:hypothetical protein